MAKSIHTRLPKDCKRTEVTRVTADRERKKEGRTKIYGDLCDRTT